MSIKRICKIVGIVSEEVVKRYNLYDYRNTKIVQSLDLYQHVSKHIKEFKSVDSFNRAIFNIEKIIANPYFVYYDSLRNSLLYFNKIDENVCVVVRLNKDNYVASIYQVNMHKILRLKEQSYIKKDYE